MKNKYWSNKKEAIMFLETMAKENVYMTAGDGDSYRSGIERVNEALRLLK